MTPTVEIAECEKEPIHIPGLVQPHGVLIVLNPSNLEIIEISANSESVFGCAPEKLVGTILPDRFPATVREPASKILRSESSVPYSNPLKILIETGDTVFDCNGIAHHTGEHLVLELEQVASDDEGNTEVTDRSIEHYFKLTSETLQEIAGTSSLEEASRIICEKLKSFTGFDRVMFYQFAPDFHGEVIAEAREPELDPFLGLHYPATDIPRIARELYVRNMIRLIGDVEATPVPLVPGELTLDMTDCHLRAVSPVHVQYLRNMGVRSSMSISLVDNGELWGLLACHHYQEPHLVSYSTRLSCVHYGMVLSPQLCGMKRHFRAESLAHRQKVVVDEVKALSGIPDMREAVRSRFPQLMSLLQADGITLIMGDQVLSSGDTPSPQGIRGIIENWFTEEISPVVDCDSLSQALPHMGDEDLGVAGFIGFRCGANWNLLLFRNEYLSEIRWAGRPAADAKSGDPLTPRHSFEEWKEEVRHHCRPWSEADRKIAFELRSALMAFVLQQSLHVEKLNMQLSEKNREIQQFAYSVSHDLKSPLVTINGWIGILEDELGDFDSGDVRQSIERIRKAATRMEGLIEDLLAFSRIGHIREKLEQMDMDGFLRELKGEYEIRLEREGAELRLIEPLPALRAYPTEVARIFHNLIDNALKYGFSDTNPVIEIRGELRGDYTRYFVSDSGPGIDPSYHKRIFDLFQRVDTAREGTGLGLASVAKVAQLHGGSCGVHSTPGNGAEFWVDFHNHLDN